MLTLNQAKELKYGDYLIDNDGKRWKVNGKVKLWKTDTSRIQIPLKHGLYRYARLTGADFGKKGICTLVTKEGGS